MLSDSKKKHDLTNILFRLRSFFELLEVGAIDEKIVKELVPGLIANIDRLELELIQKSELESKNGELRLASKFPAEV